MRSMTGYGRVEKSVANYDYIVEIKSLNGKFLNLKTSVAGIFSPLEIKLQEYLKKHFGRGNLNVYVDIRFLNPESFVKIDTGLAKAYNQGLNNLINELGLQDKVTLDILTRFREIVRINVDEDTLDVIWEGLSQCLNDVVERVKEFQHKEGEKLQQVLLDYLTQIERLVMSIQEKSGDMKQLYRDKLINDLKDLVPASDKINEDRLEMEIGMLAERADISEELERLKIHVSRFREIILSKEEFKGQNLDFLSQEMHREFNTIASKSKLVEVTNYSIDGRVIVNKIREQVQNVH